jgi:hypothetical protein
MLKDELSKLPLQLLVLFGTLALYLITNALIGSPDNPYNFIPPIIGLLILVEILVFVGLEVKEGAQKHGWKHEIVDTIIALAVAVGIWYGASFILNTDSPVSAVASCSMLPELQRGDFVIVQGAPVAAHEISMTQAELDSIDDPAVVFYDDKNISMEGSVFSYCLSERARGQSSELCDTFVSEPQKITEKKGVFTYNYGRCPIIFTEGADAYQPCVESVTFKGKEYLINFSHDVIVYNPPEGDYYSFIGDIVHRAVFKIDVDGKNYYITRGCNNPIMDVQVYSYEWKLTNHPIPEENLRGKVILRVPFLGYFKLFVSGLLVEDPQCRTQLKIPHE